MAAPSDEPPQDARHRRGPALRGWWLLVAMSAVAVVGIGWVDGVGALGLHLSTNTVQVVTLLAYAVLALWGGTLVLRAARDLSGRARVAWVTLSCGVLTWCLAALLGLWSPFVGLQAVDEDVIHAAVFAANLLLVLAVALLPPSSLRPHRTRRIDTAIMATAAICLMWSMRIDRALDPVAPGEGLLAGIDALTAYTLLNFVAIVVAVAALTRCRPDRRGEIVPLAAALVLSSIANVLAQLSMATGDQFGGRTAAGLYIAALALFVVVGRRLGDSPARGERPTQPGVLALPELATLVALAALALRQRLNGGPSGVTLVLGTVLVLLAIVRLGQLEREQRNLTRSLETSAQRLRSEARTDMLTGLGNRLALDERLQLAVERQRRSSAPAQLSVFYIDLDHFKRINDGLGHQVGDELLLEVARRLRTVLGQDVFRVGGDEFVAFREHHEPDTADSMATAALGAFKPPVLVGGHELNVAISIGLVTRSFGRADERPLSSDSTTSDSDDAGQLLRQADLALYSAKELGRGRIARYDPNLQRRADQVLALQQGLRRAIPTGEIEVHYRPVMDLVEGNIAGAQALLRWNSHEYGMLTPRSFIDAASAAALLPQLDSMVFDDITAALRTTAAIAATGTGPPLWISTRLSRVELNHPVLVELVERTLTSSGCDPARLRIEVSEDTIVDPATLEVLLALAELGVHLTVAAFGTGPSSLIRLNRYPAATIKLDRSFVEGLGRRRDDTLVVSTVAELAGDLGLELAAEGISEQFQVDLLAGLGCRLGQGRYFGSASSRAAFFEHHVDGVHSGVGR